MDLPSIIYLSLLIKTINGNYTAWISKRGLKNKLVEGFNIIPSEVLSTIECARRCGNSNCVGFSSNQPTGECYVHNQQTGGVHDTTPFPGLETFIKVNEDGKSATKLGTCTNNDYDPYIDIGLCIKSIQGNGHSFSTDWADAGFKCNDDGGKLLMMKPFGAMNATLDELQSGDYWVGGRVVDGTWLWLDGSEVDMSVGWTSNTNASYTDGSCLEYRVDSNSLSDKNCTVVSKRLCEMEMH